ncbi:MAG TPA: PorT family protein [Bacteroides sp.]|nr:PorT family protein [Bacteroides sp.]
MTKGLLRLTPLLTFLFCFSELIGQESNCLERLDNAEILFNSGIFEDIPFLIEDCLESYSEENTKKAYRLIVLAYYMNDEVESAEISMKNLLLAYPEYRPSLGDQAEYLFVFESFKVRKVIDLGFMAGPIFTPGNLLEPFSPFQDRFLYASNLPGISAGVMINVPITSLFSISTEPTINRYAFQIQYDNPINEIYAIDQTETNIMLNIPLNVRFTFLNNRFQPYVKFGGQMSLLLSVETESKLERLDPVTGEIINPSETIKRDHSIYRERLNYYVGGGLGLRMNFNKFYLFAEADYYHPLNNMLASDQNRFEQSNLWSEAWVDSDFRIIHAFFRVGIARSLYSIKKIR